MERAVIVARGVLRVIDPAEARESIAKWWLSSEIPESDVSGSITLGEIELRPHQSSAVARLSAAIEEFGGALLCDEAGTGKTFIALAVARKAGKILVVAPASLQEMWHRAAGRSGLTVAFTSFERLSRKSTDAFDFQFLVVDEAHHARNPSTARYAALAALASTVPTLLLTATPVHNRLEDISALMSLFLGSHAESLSESARSRCIVRRGKGAVTTRDELPRIESANWCHITHDETLPASLLELPPPLPPRNGGDGGALIARSLVRQWSSSDAALIGGLKRRMGKCMALIAGLESGVYPSRHELAAWAGDDDSIQFAFPQLVAQPSDETAELLAVAKAHYDALRRIFHAQRALASRDQERAAVIREISRRHATVKIVAFSQYADTVIGLFRALESRSQVAALTSRGAQVAGGMLTRQEALDRFAPIAAGVPLPRAADRIALLLTTDLLSEGVNLQDAAVVIHLDLPWTPARLEQRTGRIVRLGSRHDRVWSYAIKPPASAETLLRIEKIIESKIRIARAAIGDAGPVLPSSDIVTAPSRARPPEGLTAAPVLGEAIRCLMVAWSNAGSCRRAESSHLSKPSSEPDAPMVTSVAATCDGFLAACTIAGKRMLLTSRAGRATEDLGQALEMAALCSGAAVPIAGLALRSALLALHSHFREGEAMRDMTPESISAMRMRTALLQRIAAVAGRARPHLRGRVALDAERARAVVIGRYGLAAEAALCRLADSSSNDEDWLQSLVNFGTRWQASHDEQASQPSEIFALILLQRPTGT